MAGSVEQQIMDEVGIKILGENTYGVTGSTGNQYTVRWVGRGDDDHTHLWDCDCPARVTCKHIKLVAEASARIADELGYE